MSKLIVRTLTDVVVAALLLQCFSPGVIYVEGEPLECTFEAGFCGWQNATWSNGTWKRHRLGTVTINTGPQNGHTNATQNYYIYLEVNDFNQNGLVDTGRGVALVSPTLNSTRCFRFFYHMYGTGVGKLTVGVVSLDPQQKSELWSKVGNQNNSWHCAAVNIARQTNGRFQVYIDARTGSDIRGDIAIDDLKLYSTSPCNQSECDSSTPTTSSPGSTSSNTPSETTSLSTSIKTTTYIDNSPKTTISNTVSTTPGIVIDTALYYMIAIPVAVLLAAIVIGIVCYCRKSSTPPSDDDADNISEYMELDESAITSVKHNGQIVFPQNIDGHVYEEPVSGGSSGGGYDSSAPRLPAKSQSIDDVDYIDMDADPYTTSSSAPRVSTAEESGMTAPPPCGNFGYITAVHIEQPNDP